MPAPRFLIAGALALALLVSGSVLASPSFSERVLVSVDSAIYLPKLQIDGAGLPRLSYLSDSGTLIFSSYRLSGSFSDLR